MPNAALSTQSELWPPASTGELKCVQVALDRKGRQQVPISLKTDTCKLTEGSPTGQHAKNHDKASGVCKPKRQQIRQSHEWAWTEKHRGHGSPHAKESPIHVYIYIYIYPGNYTHVSFSGL